MRETKFFNILAPPDFASQIRKLEKLEEEVEKLEQCVSFPDLVGCPSEHRRGLGRPYGLSLDSIASAPLLAQDRMYPFRIIRVGIAAVRGRGVALTPVRLE